MTNDETRMTKGFGSFLRSPPEIGVYRSPGRRVGRAVRGPPTRGAVGLTAFDPPYVLPGEIAMCRYRCPPGETRAAEKVRSEMCFVIRHSGFVILSSFGFRHSSFL